MTTQPKKTGASTDSVQSSRRKEDTLTKEHLTWLVGSRTANQTAALKLFQLLSDYPIACRTKRFSKISQDMVSVCFSLWRAAFLADKIGTRTAVVEDARSFLGKLLTDNAVTYPQDRNSREFTFNYYMANAINSLLLLSVEAAQVSEDWTAIKSAISDKPAKLNTNTVYQNRWDRGHRAFEVALVCYSNDIEAEDAKWTKAARKLIVECEKMGMDTDEIIENLSLPTREIKNKLKGTSFASMSSDNLRIVVDYAKLRLGRPVS